MHAAQFPDRTITQQANQKLVARGIRSPCHVEVITKNGEVTLSGNVQFAYQKGAATHAISGMTGVRRVVDHLVVKPVVKR
jgi:osmotically-inducible protein OsmY